MSALDIQWAEQFLIKQGYQINNPCDPIRNMPWSQVTRFSTDKGFVYLKHMAPQFANEPTVLDFLFHQLKANVPEIIAANAELHCFMMKQAGTAVLRDVLKINYQTELVIKVFKIYANIQLEAIPQVDRLMNIGVKDSRLNVLPQYYQGLIEQEALLRLDGLSLEELRSLQQLHNKFVDLCAQLSEYPIPQTIEHGDFHDNNILLDQDKITINDWGDATITHPFFSLGSWLNSASRHHQLQKSDPRYSQLTQAYLESWLSFGSMAQLQQAFLLSERIRPIVFALNFSRVASCPGMEQLGQFKGYMAEAFREFILSGYSEYPDLRS